MKNVNMRKIIFSAAVLAVPVIIMSNSSCDHSQKKHTPTHKDSVHAVEEVKKEQEKVQAQQEADKLQHGFVKATVIDNTGLDGCRFMIVLESGQKLMPLNLEERFMKDNMKVWVKYVFAKDAMTVCMAGEAVNIVAIEERW